MENCEVKIIGVNRVVCLSCKRAICHVCEVEVDADPRYGHLHYSPDQGYLLGFLGMCPLYDKYQSYTDWWGRNGNTYKNVRDCNICKQLKKEYPEYDIYLEKRKPRLKYPAEPWETSTEFGAVEIEPEYYSCNLCRTEKDFVCQFDQNNISFSSSNV